MFMAGVHGDETAGVDIVRVIQTKLSNAPRESLNGTRVVLMPLVNPDGYAAGTRQNANSVDINRNFPDGEFGTGEKSGKFYGGESAASEPETKAIIDVVTKYKPELIITLHAALACVNYNGPCIDVAEKISKAIGLPAVGDIGYPTPGSMGNYYGLERNLPVITLELPEEEVDHDRYADVLLNAAGVL